jgi:porin
MRLPRHIFAALLTFIMAAPPALLTTAPAFAQTGLQVPPSVAQSEAYPPNHPDLLDGTLSGKGDLEDDEQPKPGAAPIISPLQPWFDFKDQLAARTGIRIGGSYGVLGQDYSQSLIDEEDAVGGKLTLNLSWELINRGQPNAFWYELVAEQRGPIGTELPPLQAGLATGSIVPTAATWGQFDFGVTQNYVRQDLFNHAVQYAVGKIFAPNFIDAFPFFDDNRQFLNQTYSTSPTIPAPLRGFGMVGAIYPTQGSFYVKGGIYTNHSDDTGVTIDKFFEDPEHFYHVELGLSALARSGVAIQARGPMDTNNISVTLWRRDPQNFGDEILHKGSEGVAFNFNYLIADDVMVFARAGWSSGWVIDRAWTVGFGWRPRWRPSDLAGFGFGTASPENEFLPMQKTVEVFYRWQVTQNFAITPDLQFITDPPLDILGDDAVWVGSVRSRLTF